VTGLRTAAKRALERLVVAGGGAALARAWRQGETLILAYHNVVPHGEPVRGERSLHLPQRAFAAQLDILARTHDVVPLPEALEAPRTPRSRRPRAAITFDDAYRGAVTAGADELRRRSLPATVFVAPAFVGDGTLWWDALADPVTGTMPSASRAYGMEQLAGCDGAVRTWARERGWSLHDVPPHQRVASQDELAGTAAQGGITLGSHSWSHPNLTRLGDRELAEELRRPLTWLRERFTAAAIPWLAYPYGLADQRVEQAARDAGYVGALWISGGWVGRGGSAAPHALPRFNVPAGLSEPGFVLRAAGLGSR
jgi:peptidoglycan/xylan/chitin deacetylase (PgdA/CDA1 family)